MTDISKYLGYITSEHRAKPKFAAAITALVTPAAAMKELIASLPAAFDLDTAVGVQLDVLGLWLGQSRIVTIPLNVYFSFNIEGLGFNQGIWKGPDSPDNGPFTLPDQIYRRLLKVRAYLQTTWDGSVEDAYVGWDAAFAGTGIQLLIQDNGNLSMVIGMDGTPPDAVTLALFLAGYYDARPAGVQITHVVPTGDGPLFGWGIENAYVSGWGEGEWAATA